LRETTKTRARVIGTYKAKRGHQKRSSSRRDHKTKTNSSRRDLKSKRAAAGGTRKPKRAAAEETRKAKESSQVDRAVLKARK
jgi:hypothetical protein